MPIPLSYLIIEPNKDKSDYLCLLSNPKLGIPRSPRQQKRRRVIKNVLEPSNFNAQINNSRLSTHQLVSSNQRLFEETSAKSLNGSTNSLQTPTSSTASTSVPKDNMLSKGTAKKRKISDNGYKSSESQSIEEKRTKLVSKENLAQVDSKSKAINNQTDNEITFTEDDDSSTDVSETSFQINLICKSSDSGASCGEVEKSSSATNSTTSSTTTSIESNAAAKTKQTNDNNHATQTMTPSTSATANKLLPTEFPINKKHNGKSNRDTEVNSSPNDVHIVNGPTEASLKAVVKTTTVLPTAVTNTVTVVSLAQSSVQNRSPEAPVKNAKPIEMNVPTTKEQNGNSITSSVVSSNTTFLLQSPKCDSIATSTLKSSFLDSRKDVAFAPLVNKATNVEAQSALAKPATNGHSKKAEVPATTSGNTLPVLTTNGRSKFCFSQLTQRPEFFSKTFNLFPSNMGNNTAQSSINIDSTLPKNAQSNSINSTK